MFRFRSASVFEDLEEYIKKVVFLHSLDHMYPEDPQAPYTVSTIVCSAFQFRHCEQKSHNNGIQNYEISDS